MPATMPATPFHAPIHGMINCQNGSHAGIFGSAPASPGSLEANIHVFVGYLQDRRAEVVKV
jgi:hypothetical protein